MKLSRLLSSNTPMKLLTTIAAVLISLSTYSQDLIEYDNGTFTQNGAELSMEQIDDLTVLYKSGRRNFRRGNRFIRLDKNQNYRITNNIGSFVVGGAAGFFGVPSALVGGIYIPYWVEEPGLPVLFGVGAGLCAVSYKAFSRIALSPAGCLRKRDREFYKVADKINQAIAAANQ
jgi:hypothetical protein